MTCNPFKARAWIVRRYDYILLLHEAEPTLENALKYDELAQEYHPIPDRRPAGMVFGGQMTKMEV